MNELKIKLSELHELCKDIASSKSATERNTLRADLKAFKGEINEIGVDMELLNDYIEISYQYEEATNRQERSEIQKELNELQKLILNV